jgi:hypothetical protein
MLDIFNLSIDDLEKVERKNTLSENEFKPNPNNSKDGVYRALIRPVYWLDNPQKSYIGKSTFYFDKDDGNTSNNNFFDSPYSIGEDCLAMDTFFDFNRQGKENARAKDIAMSIRPKSSYFYLVMVESDAVHPENEGKLMVYKAPIQFHKIVQGAIHVKEEDKKMGIKPVNVFDPFKGKSLRLAINVVSGHWNYNGTVSFVESEPVKFKGEPLSVERKQEFIEFLKEGNELMKPYVYKKMDNERYKLLLQIISQKTGKTFDILNGETPTLDVEGISDTQVEQEVEEEKSFLDEIIETKQETKVETEVETKEEIDDTTLDDILDGLDV